MGYNTQGRCDVIDSQNCEGKPFFSLSELLYFRLTQLVKYYENT